MTAPLPDGARRMPPAPRLRDGGADLVETDGARGLGLRRRADGSYAYVDPDRRFTAVIGPDGRVLFADRWRKPSRDDTQNGKCCGKPPEGFWSGINVFAGASVRGPAEWLAKATGQDPVGAAKAAMLDRTRPYRTKLAIAFHQDLLRTRLGTLQTELMTLWRADDLSLERKRELLFRRWDECDELFGFSTEGLPEDAIVQLDEMRVKAAEQARDIIEEFIRSHAAAGGPRAYTPTELERFNQQRVSVARFAPYEQRS